jgi:long-subunit acyl-CoA synthetase (AMP-forming)
MAPSTQTYLASLGMLIFDLYGMSENSGACTANSQERYALGSCGSALDCFEVAVLREDGSEVGLIY